MIRFCSLIFALATAGSAYGTTSIATGAFYIDGDYGAETDTTMWFAPLTVSYRQGGLKLSATASYLWLEGPPGSSAGGLDGNGALPASGKAEGVGDLQLKAGYDISLSSRRLQLRPQLKIKAPVADENEGLGTGATDYTMQLDTFYFVDGWWPYISIGYRWRGDSSYTTDSSEGRRYSVELEDGEIIGVGFFKPLTPSASFTLHYEHRTASVAHLADTEELLATYQYRFDTRWSTAFSAGTGFTSRSADKIYGLQLEYRY